MNKKFLYWGILPIFVLAFALLFTHAAGPYWLGPNIDPPYGYFFNSLYLLDHLPLYPTSHPGLTLDLLGAGVIKSFHPFLTHQSLFLAVIQDPEIYLHAMHALMLVIYVLTLAILGWYAYAQTSDTYFAILVQSSALFILAIPSIDDSCVLPLMAHVKPETLMVTAINLLMIGLLKLHRNARARTAWPWAVYLGFVCAFGIFTKYTFILAVPLVLCAIRGNSGRLWFIITSVFFGYLFSLVETDPYHRIVLWVWDLIIKSGYSGNMSEKFLEPAVYLKALTGLIRGFPVVFLAAGLGLWVALRKRNRVLVLTAGCVLAQFLMVAKHPGLRYMILGVGLSGLVLALLYEECRGWLTTRFVAWGITVLVLVYGVGYAVYYQKLAVKNKAIQDYAEGLRATHPGFVICPYFPASSPVYVLAMDTDDMHTYYNELLKQRYPNYYYYDINAREFKDFLSRVVPFSELMSGHRGILLYGGIIDPEELLPFTVAHEIERTSQGEALYEVTAHQSPHARDFLAYSMMMFGKGQYKDALQYALYAKMLGLPQDIQVYLNEIVVRIKGRLSN